MHRLEAPTDWMKRKMATGDAKESKEIPPGSKVVCTTCFQENVEGEVIAFDYAGKVIIISILLINPNHEFGEDTQRDFWRGGWLNYFLPTCSEIGLEKPSRINNCDRKVENALRGIGLLMVCLVICICRSSDDPTQTNYRYRDRSQHNIDALPHFFARKVTFPLTSWLQNVRQREKTQRKMSSTHECWIRHG